MSEGQPVSDYARIAAEEARRKNDELQQRRGRDPRSSNRPEVRPMRTGGVSLNGQGEVDDPLKVATVGIDLLRQRQLGQEIDPQAMNEGLQALADLPSRDYGKAVAKLNER